MLMFVVMLGYDDDVVLVLEEFICKSGDHDGPLLTVLIRPPFGSDDLQFSGGQK